MNRSKGKHKMKRCFPFLFLWLSISAHGALNKWVDAEGNVHYSDEPPPPNVNALTLTTPTALSGVPAQKTFTELELELKKAQKAKEEAAKTASQQKEDELAKQKNCAGAKANLKTFESNAQIAIYNDKGESTTMDSATRQQSIEETRKQISLYCN
jgi:hypothetical protein